MDDLEFIQKNLFYCPKDDLLSQYSLPNKIDCSLCVTSDYKLITLRCNHIFCAECVVVSVVDHARNCCALCRATICKLDDYQQERYDQIRRRNQQQEQAISSEEFENGVNFVHLFLVFVESSLQTVLRHRSSIVRHMLLATYHDRLARIHACVTDPLIHAIYRHYVPYFQKNHQQDTNIDIRPYQLDDEDREFGNHYILNPYNLTSDTICYLLTRNDPIYQEHQRWQMTPRAAFSIAVQENNSTIPIPVSYDTEMLSDIHSFGRNQEDNLILSNSWNVDRYYFSPESPIVVPTLHPVFVASYGHQSSWIIAVDPPSIELASVGELGSVITNTIIGEFLSRAKNDQLIGILYDRLEYGSYRDVIVSRLCMRLSAVAHILELIDITRSNWRWFSRSLDKNRMYDDQDRFIEPKCCRWCMLEYLTVAYSSFSFLN